MAAELTDPFPLSSKTKSSLQVALQAKGWSPPQMVSFLTPASPQELVHNSHRRGMPGTKRVADHSRSYSQEVAELGSKPTLDSSHCIACFLQSHFPASLLALVCEQPHPTRIQRRKERNPSQRSGLVGNSGLLRLSIHLSPITWHVASPSEI